jgi:hypothetical protein
MNPRAQRQAKREDQRMEDRLEKNLRRQSTLILRVIYTGWLGRPGNIYDHGMGIRNPKNRIGIRKIP